MAYQLGMPVYKLLEEMPYSELRDWGEYFSRRPSGWRDDQRTSYMIQAFGAKVKGEEIFPSLAAVHEDARKDDAHKVKKLKQNNFIAQYLAPHLKE